MSNQEDIEPLFQGAVQAITRHFVTVEGTIKDVDADQDFTCTVTVGGDSENSDFFAVPLRVLIGTQSSWLEVPTAGTACLLMFLDGNLQRPQLVMVDQIDEIRVNPSGNVVFNKGELGGMVKVIDLTTKLNNIENLLNNFIGIYNAHVHNVTAVGSPTGPAIDQETETLTPTQQKDIENKKIQQ